MPQERSDARRMERELKITFDWRVADKDLKKEERNAPIDTGVSNDLMQLETRAWKTSPDGQGHEQTSVPSRSSRPSGGGGFGRRRSGGAGPSSGRGGAGGRGASGGGRRSR